ncbi:hypothetical protein CYFUS_002914 [Cystobacter fuscus]|uniref:Uncharacterized protein n=1 Tax=Cystobacter fuscus TaxID=43 RepID=A0A250J1X0_9BACT|nr:hypothetical protein CYFUS_002914 [Cystobacter fuscus]
MYTLSPEHFALDALTQEKLKHMHPMAHTSLSSFSSEFKNFIIETKSLLNRKTFSWRFQCLLFKERNQIFLVENKD